MKRLVSILVVVAMMLASVLAMIPASANEATAPELPYNVNWKNLVDSNLMRSQWLYDRGPNQNDMPIRYQINATESSLNLALHTEGDTNGDHRQYYSDEMFDLTSDTKYVYDFEVESAGDIGGIIFAFANNPKARDEDDSKVDTEGNDIADMIAGYILMGDLNAGSVDLKFGGFWNNYGYEDGKNIKEALKDAAVDADGYTKYRIIYNGLNVKFFYLNTSGTYTELYAGKDIVLAEGAKVAFGTYTQGANFGNLRNCVLSAWTDETALTVAKSDLNNSIILGNAKKAEGIYSTATVATLTAALEAANALMVSDEATVADLVAANETLDEAIANLFCPDKDALNDKIAEATENLAEADYEADAWATYAAVLATAQTVSGDVDASQETVDETLVDLVTAIRTLVGADRTAIDAMITEVGAMDFSKYTPVSWQPLGKAFASAKKLTVNDFATQAEMDEVVAAMTAALPNLVERPTTKVLDFSVNWARLFEANRLRSQWWNDNGEGQNNYASSLYNVTVTDSLLSSSPKKDGDNKTYYSRTMFALSADTYYEYTFEAKNNRPTGYAGIMFAYDTVGTNTYFIYGEFDNSSDNGRTADFRFRRGHHDYENRDPSSHFLEGNPRYYPTLTLTEDGFGQFKFIYDGLNFSFHYLNADGEYEQIGDVITLPEGAAIAPGVYSRGGNAASQRTTAIRNVVISAFDAEDALLIAKAEANGLLPTAKNVVEPTAALTAAIAAVEAALAAAEPDAAAIVAAAGAMYDAYNANLVLAAGQEKLEFGKYTPETMAVLQTAVDALAAELAKTTADASVLANGKVAVNAAIAALVTKVDLNAKIAEIEALNLVAAEWTTTTWPTFKAAFDAAKAVSESTTATQADVNAALKALNDAYAALDSSAEGDKTALNAKIAEAEAALTADMFEADAWTAYEAVLNAAKAVSAATDETGNQTATDAALKNLVAAIKTLVNADKSNLEDAIDSANELVEGKYEAAGWPEFAAALEAAKTVFNSDVALQDAIDAAETALETAQAALVRKPIEKKTEYKVDWKYLYDNKTMKAQWFNQTWQNDFEDHFTVTATENMLHVDSKLKDEADSNPGDTRAYYSSNMIPLTATSYYEYTFSVKRDSELSTYAGVVFAYDATSVSDNQKAYLFYGGLNNLSDDGDKCYITVQYGHQDEEDRLTGPVKPVVKVDDEGYATYKIVYDGFFAHFFYTDPTTDEFVEMPALRTKLKETAKICFGTYTRDNRDENNPRTVTIKDCVLVSMNDEAATLMAVNKTALAAKIAEASALVEAEYTKATWEVLVAALSAADAVNKDAKAVQILVDNALANLTDAMAKLGKPGDTSALKAKVDEAKALKQDNYNVTGLTWNVFVKCIEDAEKVLADESATQGDIDLALANLVEKMAALGDPKTPVTPETDAPATDAPATDAPETEDKDDEDKDEDKDDDKKDEEKKGGCGSSVALSALAIVGVIGTAVVLKKKED